MNASTEPEKQSQYKANTKPIQTQYKPNSLDAQMNVNAIITKDYENKPRLRTPPKQTQSNPTCSELACPACPEPVEGISEISG
ncbi:hypothetical protein ES703_45676 [subsurface metagenome]